MKKAIQYLILFVFKKPIIDLMKSNGFAVNNKTSIKALHNFWCKDYYI